MNTWIDIPTIAGVYEARSFPVRGGWTPYTLDYQGAVRMPDDAYEYRMELIKELGPFRLLTSSRYNPILSQVRKAMAESDYTLEAMAYEGRYGCRDVLNYGYTVEDVWGFFGTREHAEQALKVFLRILRIERVTS